MPNPVICRVTKTRKNYKVSMGEQCENRRTRSFFFLRFGCGGVSCDRGWDGRMVEFMAGCSGEVKMPTSLAEMVRKEGRVKI